MSYWKLGYRLIRFWINIRPTQYLQNNRVNPKTIDEKDKKHMLVSWLFNYYSLDSIENPNYSYLIVYLYTVTGVTFKYSNNHGKAPISSECKFNYNFVFTCFPFFTCNNKRLRKQGTTTEGGSQHRLIITINLWLQLCNWAVRCNNICPQTRTCLTLGEGP